MNLPPKHRDLMSPNANTVGKSVWKNTATQGRRPSSQGSVCMCVEKTGPEVFSES